METEALPLFARQAAPVFPRRFQQSVGADDVGLNERGGSVNGAVDVRFCGQMHHGIRLVLAEYPRHLGGDADIDFFEGVSRVVRNTDLLLQIASTGELVNTDYAILCVLDEETDYCRANAAGCTGDEYFHT